MQIHWDAPDVPDKTQNMGGKIKNKSFNSLKIHIFLTFISIFIRVYYTVLSYIPIIIKKPHNGKVGFWLSSMVIGHFKVFCFKVFCRSISKFDNSNYSILKIFKAQFASSDLLFYVWKNKQEFKTFMHVLVQLDNKSMQSK